MISLMRPGTAAATGALTGWATAAAGAPDAAGATGAGAVAGGWGGVGLQAVTNTATTQSTPLPNNRPPAGCLDITLPFNGILEVVQNSAVEHVSAGGTHREAAGDLAQPG